MKLLPTGLILAVGLILVSGPIGAQTTEYLKIGPNDPHLYQRFGSAVAIQGRWAVVGAEWDPSSGPHTGAVYVFDLTTRRQRRKLVPAGLAVEDRFGASVAVSGDTVIAGAPGSDIFGKDSGAAYVFDIVTGQQLAKLVPNQGSQRAEFGSSVGIDGGVAIVGAPWDSNHGYEVGAAYLFDVFSGLQLKELIAAQSNPMDEFGTAVAIQGARALVGAPQYYTQAMGYIGAVYVFDTNSGNELRQLTPLTSIYGQRFGAALAISGPMAIIGAPYTHVYPYKLFSGAAYLFDYTSGQQLAKLEPEPVAKQYFGTSVGINGARAIVGADGGLFDSKRVGLAYVFDASTGQEVNKLLASDGEEGDLFGRAVGIQGSVAIVSARDNTQSTGNDGAAYLFYPVGPWEQSPINGHWYLGANLDQTWAMAEAEARRFGGHLATIRSQAENAWLMGNPELNDRPRWIGYNDVAVEGQFEWISGEPVGFENWSPGEPDDLGGADWTAWDPATGMWSDEPQAPGRASIVEVISPDCDGNLVPDVYQIARDRSLDWDGNGVLDSCSPPNFCTALINSTGVPASIGAQGSPVVSEDSLTLTAWDLPLNQTGYFMASESQGYLPHFGGSAGILCLGAPIYRFSSPASGGAVLDSGDTGTVELTLDFGLLPQGVTFDPGETWYFQLWYRDVDSSGPTSNTTDGLTVLFR